MRTIKFRAWDRLAKLMYLDPYCMETTSLNEALTIGNEDYVLMQFTGLKDKNGKEIYEGDILFWQSPEEEKGHGDKYEVVWNDDGFRLRWIDKKFTDHYSNISPIYEFEVIGNIYENPELLK